MASRAVKARERGFALLIVLWAVVLLTVIGTGVTGAGRADLQLAGNLRGAAAAEAAADGAVFEAAFHLLDPARPWVADGRAYTIGTEGARTTVRIEDEAGKVNPNTASAQLLGALLRQVGADRQTAERVGAAIADWHAPQSAPLSTGPRAAQYRAAGLEYAPPGAPFQSLDELGAVLGMTPPLLARLRPYLSILVDTEPDPLAASTPVLEALRELSGRAPGRTGPAIPPRTVTVTAETETTRGSRFVRRAAVRLGSTPREPLVSILGWSAPER